MRSPMTQKGFLAGGGMPAAGAGPLAGEGWAGPRGSPALPGSASWRRRGVLQTREG